MSNAPADWPSTQALIRAAQAGSAGGVNELLARIRPRLLARVRVLMGPQARANEQTEDVVQQAMVEALPSLPAAQLASPEAFLAWLTGIARNNIRDAVRRKREAALAEFSRLNLAGNGVADTTTAGQHAVRNEEIERLVGALADLSADYGQVLELRYFEKLPVREVAQRMGRTEKAVERLQARALIQLGRLLARRE